MLKIYILVIGALALTALAIHGVAQAHSINYTSIYLSRAITLFNALQRHYFVSSLNIYRGSTCGHYACLWPYSQVLAASTYLAELPGLGNLTSMFNKYYIGLSLYENPRNPALGYESAVAPPLGPGGDTYYDDNEWVALALVRMYELTGDSKYLNRAIQLFNFIVGGWSRLSNLTCPGGIYWKVGGLSRNTCSNGPAAELAAELYLITGNSTYLNWAIRIFNWVNTCLRSPLGLYYDHINPDGTVDETIWSYNQGTMMGAAALLYLATGNRTYLRLAEQIAQASINYFNTTLLSQPPYFNAILLRNLAKVAYISGNRTIYREYLKMLLMYANLTWIAYRDPETNLITMGIPASAVNPDDVIIDTAAVIQVYALAAGAPVILPKPMRISHIASIPAQYYALIALVIVVVLLAAYLAYRLFKGSSRIRRGSLQ